MYGLVTRIAPHSHISEGLKRYTRPHRGQSDHLRIWGNSKSSSATGVDHSAHMYNLSEFVVLMKGSEERYLGLEKGGNPEVIPPLKDTLNSPIQTANMRGRWQNRLGSSRT